MIFYLDNGKNEKIFWYLERNRNEYSFIFLDNDNIMILTYDVYWVTYLYFIYIHIYLFLNNIKKFTVHFFLEIWQIYVENRSLPY